MTPGVGMEAQQGRRSAEVRQQPPGSTGVLRSHHRNGAEYLSGSAGQVTQIAQRSGDDVEGTRGHETSGKAGDGGGRRDLPDDPVLPDLPVLLRQMLLDLAFQRSLG